MAKRKDDELKSMSILSDKDVLIAYCSTLTELKARKAYKMLRDEFEVDRTKTIRLNRNGNQDDSGYIRMTRKQHDKMLKECGEYKYHWLIACVYDYITFLKGQADEGDARAKRQFKLYTSTSIYPKLMKGWVMDRYNKEATPPPTTVSASTIDFYSINTIKDAVEYIVSLPSETISTSPEVEYLCTKYPEVLRFVNESLS